MAKKDKESYQLNISKLCADLSLEELQSKMEEKMQDRKESKSVQLLTFGSERILYFSYIIQNERRDVEWFEKWKQFFSIPHSLRATSLTGHGIIIIELKTGTRYMLSFGKAFALLRDNVVQNYGIAMAEKLFDGNSIDSVSSKYFSLTKSKSITSYLLESSYNFGEGEAADLIKAKIVENHNANLSHITNLLQLIKPLISITYSSIKLTLSKEKIELSDLIRVCSLLEQIELSYPSQCDIPQMKPVDKEKSVELDNVLFQHIKEKDTSVLFSIPFFNKDESDKLVFLDNIESVTLQFRQKTRTYFDFTVSDLFDFVEDNPTIQKLNQIHCSLKNSYYEPMKVPLEKWLEAQIDLQDTTYALYNGKWYTFNDEYFERVDKQLKQIESGVICVADEIISEATINSFCESNKDEIVELFRDSNTSVEFDKVYREFRYNYYVAKSKHMLLFDRAFGSKVEVCDLSCPGKSLIHCKIGDTSSLEECLRQSILGTQYFLQNKKQILQMKDKFGNDMQDITEIQVYFLSDKNLPSDFKISSLKSLKCKLSFLHWHKTCEEHGLTPSIIIYNYQKQ